MCVCAMPLCLLGNLHCDVFAGTDMLQNKQEESCEFMGCMLFIVVHVTTLDFCALHCGGRTTSTTHIDLQHPAIRTKRACLSIQCVVFPPNIKIIRTWRSGKPTVRYQYFRTPAASNDVLEQVGPAIVIEDINMVFACFFSFDRAKALCETSKSFPFHQSEVVSRT